MFIQHSSKAILHIDADAFFASCEQALNPAYKNKPVITGAERNIVSCASYEAKKLGIKRGIPLWEIKKKFPQAIILPSHYESYSLFSKRMFDIIKRYSSEVEEYSIDEAFVDITGLRSPLHMSYPQIARKIKQAIEKELDITVSVGLSYTKVLAKIASKWNKPNNFTVINSVNLEEFLKKTELVKVWGIGQQTTYYLYKYQLKTAWDYFQKSEIWIDQHMHKQYKEIWHELHGKSIYAVSNKEKNDYQGISKTKTFTPASNDINYVFSQLSKNIENACIKARRHNLVGKRLIVYLKTKDFRHCALEIRLTRASSFPSEILPLAKQVFTKIFKPQLFYRATGVVLFHLQSRDHIQLDLFEPAVKIEKMKRLFESLDKLSEKFGKHTVFLGSSLLAHDFPDQRKRLYIGNPRQFIGLPLMGQVR